MRLPLHQLGFYCHCCNYDVTPTCSSQQLHDCCAETETLSLLQAVDPSGEGSATRVLLLHSARFSASSTLSCRSSMLCLTTAIHLFLCLPLLRCPPTFASKIRLIQSSSSRRCTCPYHLSLASRTLSVIHATPRMRRMSSFLFLSLKVRPRIHRNFS